jgi:hypothetical protein
VRIWLPAKTGSCSDDDDAEIRSSQRPVLLLRILGVARASDHCAARLGEESFSMYYLDDYGTVSCAKKVQPLVGELDVIAVQAGFTYAPA